MSGMRLQTQLVDFVAGSLHRCRSAKPNKAFEKPQSWSALEDAIEKVALLNGFSLDRSTLSNGECGVDAILRNLEWLNLPDAGAREVVAALRLHGREAALSLLRAKVVKWLSLHPTTEVLPEVTLTDYVQMDGIYATWKAYLDNIRRPYEWVDTLAFIAASALFKVQFLVLVGNAEPQLLVAPSVILEGRGVPLAAIANIGNFHFYALKKMGDDHHSEQLEAREDDALLESQVVAVKEEEDLPVAEDAHTRNYQDEVATPLQQGTDPSDLFTFAQQITQWFV